MRELLIGCGTSRVKKLSLGTADWQNVTTLDNEESHHPDVLWDLEELPYPFEDDSFDEIHAYEVLEHTGVQGDYKFFFAQWTELHRILKKGGKLFATCPSWRSMWAWGDPSHKRVITAGTLVFLSQEEYAKQIGVTPMSDYRSLYKADFKTLHIDDGDEHLVFVLEAL